MVGPRQVVMTFADTKIPAQALDSFSTLAYLLCQALNRSHWQWSEEDIYLGNRIILKCYNK
jgi:hypothetical protein